MALRRVVVFQRLPDMAGPRRERRRPGGYERLKHPELNKGTAFTPEEREQYGLRGLLPAGVSSQATQVERALENMRRKCDDIERYIFLLALQGRNERLFYRLVMENLEETLPLIYTPTVGQACLEFAHIFRQPRGFYITPGDRGQVRKILRNWPERDVRLIVVTDGERILGLGDLGANGMGIPIGKLSLYTACAGIPPAQCMPVVLDVGTGNTALCNDPLYLGTRQARLRGAEYDALVDEFISAVQEAFPRALIQFEDFRTANAYRLLARYRKRVLCFNDDIQGTAAVTLAGIEAACRITGVQFVDLRFLFLGAGSASTGIAHLVATALRAAGLSGEQARARLWLCDSQGLLISGRDRLAPHNRQYAQDTGPATFIEAMQRCRPHVLIGATGVPGTFSEQAVRLMAAQQERPVIFALSNPTSRAECTAAQAYAWSNGRAVYAGGSPFAAVVAGGATHYPGQANNAYVFPGIGLGAIASGARRISDAMLLAAARALAARVTDQDLARGTLFPPLSDIRAVSHAIACAVAEQAWQQADAQTPCPPDPATSIAASMYQPYY